MKEDLPILGDIVKREPLASSTLVPQEKLDRQGYQPGDFWLGRTLSGLPLGWTDDVNLLTCAGTRAGKGVSVVIPNLLLYPGSAVVIDPKGELASETAEHRAQALGQKVIVLDPAGVADVPPELRGTFNPLSELDPSSIDVISAAQSIAAGIVVPNPGAKEPFWDQTALNFLQAV
ncbi:MAG: type IV secretory system conjugative DNA transfer family protein, partial [Pseudomonadota bacterium]